MKRLSNKINAAQAAKAPERSTKLAYVAGALRGGHMRKPKQNGFNLTGEKRKDLMGLFLLICFILVWFFFLRSTNETLNLTVVIMSYRIGYGHNRKVFII